MKRFIVGLLVAILLTPVVAMAHPPLVRCPTCYAAAKYFQTCTNRNGLGSWHDALAWFVDEVLGNGAKCNTNVDPATRGTTIAQ